MRLADVRPVPGVPETSRACHRLDPYWDGLWSEGAHAYWVSAPAARARQRAGIARLPAGWNMDAEEAWEILTREKFRAVTLSMLGAVGAWRTLTAAQLAAFVDYPPLAETSNITRAAFAAAMLDMGVFASGMSGPSPDGPATSFRLSRSRVLERNFLPTCTYPERVVVTGGRRVLAGGQYDRHNMLTAELALRTAEMCDVGAVLGETMSTLDHLVGTGLGRGKVTDSRSADATFVRGDGLRIAVELTASDAPGFKKKVHRWAQVLASNTLETSGLVVLFIVAAPPDRGRGREVASELRSTLTDILRDYPGAPGRRPGDRIFLAEWARWFPGSGEVDESFLSLTAELPPYSAGDPWRTVEMLNPFDLQFAPTDPDRMTAVLNGAANLGASPTWLRTDPHELWPLALQRAGLDEPVLPPRKRGDRGPGSFAVRRGALTGPVQVPPALLPRPHVYTGRATRSA